MKLLSNVTNADYVLISFLGGKAPSSTLMVRGPWDPLNEVTLARPRSGSTRRGR
ncbi:MAG: hypothetical protein R3A47_07085 [Polyangiales bacterium]